MRSLKRVLKDQGGVTAVESAIILIPLAVVAVAFSLMTLSLGLSTEAISNRVTLTGPSEGQYGLEPRGSVVITRTSSAAEAEYISFDVALAPGRSPVTLSTAGPIVVSYRDRWQRRELTTGRGWSLAWPGYNDGDDRLESGELAQIRLDLTPAGADLIPKLGPNTTFDIEIGAPTGTLLEIERTTPARIDEVTNLH